MSNNFELIAVDLPGVFVIQPKIFSDHRGFFLETYSKRSFIELGIKTQFVQSNMSLSKKGVLRGIHFQKHFPQCKLVSVVTGSIYDVAVDLRQGSKTFGQWYGVELSGDNKKMLYIPEGFGHGFLSLEDDTRVIYMVSDFYDQSDEGGILYKDEELNIDWPNIDTEYIVSEKDSKLGDFIQFTKTIDLV